MKGRGRGREEGREKGGNLDNKGKLNFGGNSFIICDSRG